MRITESTKPSQNRPLKFWFPKDFNNFNNFNNFYPSIEDSFITSAPNDLHLNEKTVHKHDINLLNDLLTGKIHKESTHKKKPHYRHY